METKLTLEEVRKTVDEIKREAGNPEVAHKWEDDLREDVLRYIASGECVDPASYAKEVLRTGEISFPRWYA